MGGNQEFQKRANMALVMRAIRQSRRISRIEIASQLDLKKSTITNIVTELIARGTVVENELGEASPQGGRKPVYLGIREDFGSILGLEVQPNFYRAVLTDMNNRVLSMEQEFFPGKFGDVRELFAYVIGRTRKTTSGVDIPLIGIGIGIPGYINHLDGTIVRSWSHNLTEYPLTDLVPPDAGVPVLFDNDSNCCAWGELWSHPHENNFLYILDRFPESDKEDAGRGIGIGIVINGSVYYGSSCAAGEFKSLYWRYPNVPQVSLSLDELSELPRNPSILRRYVIELFENLSMAVSILDPKKLIIGGNLQHYRGLIDSVLDDELKYTWLSQPENECRIVYSDLGDFEVAIGAAGFVLSRLFSIPQLGYPRQFLTIGWEDAFRMLPSRKHQEK